MGELKKWRDQKWVRIGTDGSIKGACGTSKNKKNPDRCLPLAKANSMTPFIIFGGIFGGLAMLMFGFFEGFWSTTVAVLFLGISTGTVTSAQTVLALDSRSTRELGEEVVLSTYRSTQRLAMGLGPIGMSIVISYTSNANKAAVFVGAAYLVFTVFFLLSRLGGKTEHVETAS